MKIEIPLCPSTLVLARPWTFRTDQYWMGWPLIRAVTGKHLSQFSGTFEHTFPVGTKIEVLNLYMNAKQTKLARLRVPYGRRSPHIWPSRENLNEMEIK